MSDSKIRRRSNSHKVKMRFVTKSRWELPFHQSKPYQNKTCEDVESKMIRVRNPLSSFPVNYPDTYSFVRNSESSASCDDLVVYDFTERHIVMENPPDTGLEPTLKVHSPSNPPQDNIAENSEEFHRSTDKVLQDHEDKPGHRIESFKCHWNLTKLSKMTKLVNEFLSNTRTRVSPIIESPDILATSAEKDNATEITQKIQLPIEKSVDDQPKNDENLRNQSSFSEVTHQESVEKTVVTGKKVAERKTVTFRDDFNEINKGSSDMEDDIVRPKRRSRAPSLSIASAVPSFGKVVIAIDDIDSSEEEEELKRTEDNAEHPSNFVLKDYSEITDQSRDEEDGEKISQDFLKVPEVKGTSSSFYPGHDRSKIPQVQSAESEDELPSNLLMESEELKNKRAFWPRKSIIHVLKALKTMKHSRMLNAKVEAETNQFFSVPLEIYTPSASTSSSSNETPPKHDQVTQDKNQESIETKKSIIRRPVSSFHTIVLDKLISYNQDHRRRIFKRTARTFTEEDTILGAKSERHDAALSSFYTNYISSGVEIKENNKMPSNDAIDIPPIPKIFPRLRADKCLACMQQSHQINQLGSTGQKIEDTLLDDRSETISFPDPSELLGLDFPTEMLMDQSYKLPQVPILNIDTEINKSPLEEHLRSSLKPSKDHDSTTADFAPISASESALGSLGRTVSQADDNYRSNVSERSPPKSLANAKSIISPLSLPSERSRSTSDQDDSDQGGNDGGTDSGMPAGAGSQFIAPYHMPINLTPSLEAFDALRDKKSRSIQSRVASAEKSVVSASADDDTDDDEDMKIPVVAAKSKIGQSPFRFDVADSSGRNSVQTISPDKSIENFIAEQLQIYDSQSRSGSEDNQQKIRRSVDDSYEDGAEDFLEKPNETPIISDRDVIKISAKCLAENKTMTDIFQILVKEYSKRMSEKLFQEESSLFVNKAVRSGTRAKKLLALLADSKSYFNEENTVNFETSDPSLISKQPALCDPRQLRRILPLKSYNMVAPILGITKLHPGQKTSQRQESKRKSIRTTEDPDNLVGPSELNRKVSFEKEWKDQSSKLNPYFLFLMKPRRKAVTWRPLTEEDLEGYDPDSSLKLRATKITDRICVDFCRWLETLGVGTGRVSCIDADVLKDMFETDFSSEVCKTMQVSINEMPMVPSAVAAARHCPDAAELALTQRNLKRDARAEKKPKISIGFGTALPEHLKFLPPHNHVDDKWLQCENVPIDLETMDAVWKGITHLTSVKGFIDWLKAHPEVKRPKALQDLLIKKEKLMTRQSQDVSGFGHLELELDQIQSLKVGDNDPDA